LEACDSTLSGDSVPSSTPTHSFNQKPLPANDSVANFDAAADYLSTTSNDSPLPGPSDIPRSITNPSIRNELVRAVNFRLADDAITQYDGFASTDEAIKDVNKISDPAIKAQVVTALTEGVFSDVLADIDTGYTDLADTEQKFLKKLLSEQTPDQTVNYEAEAEKVQAFKQLEGTKDKAYNDGNDALHQKLSDQIDAEKQNASDASDTYSAGVRDTSAALISDVYGKSPKLQKEIKDTTDRINQQNAECKATALTGNDSCAADNAIAFADNYDIDDFTTWAKLVKTPKQRDRIESAAADEALVGAQNGYPEQAYDWQPYVKGTKYSDKVDKALVNAANQYIDEGYPELATDIVPHIASKALRAQVHLKGN
jgi:hypothetical protein